MIGRTPMRGPALLLWLGAVIVAAAVAGAGAGSGPALADTASATLSVSVVVTGPPCTVNAGTIDFGTYTSGQSSHLVAGGTLDYANCGPGTLRVELDGGRSGNVAARRLQLQGGASTLSYGLFQDANRTVVFGTGNAALSVAAAAGGSGKINVYGRIAGKQTVTAGTYTDTVGVTVTF